ncbi:Uncharacterized membrane protein YsdA, DUF1294 family [Salibacterium halotolerans]|uniref:Uncharacterized membrane protein YsdA, DUF1294 family n=2 Tax=Salibacterium halotolerans TaxID=1884432 RepID=A0A1I5SLX2_9BACI|nr:Uncharacterized membrane protein YsdA, DUF1294 family [Salibacterium halotolerans]
MVMWFILYAAAVNLLSFAAAGSDKYKARRKKRRIPEKRLWLLTWAGGSAGMLAAMYLFRHKTRHLLFKAGVPLIFALHVIIILYLTLQ